MHRRSLTLFLVAAVALAGCGRLAPLPEGPQEVTGTLERVPLSLSRRGTHMLRDEQEDEIAYVESPSVNVGPLEGETVTLLGTYEENTNPRDLPVLVVEKILKGGENTLKHHDFPGLGAGLDLPALWEGSPEGALVVFRELGETDSAFEARVLGSGTVLPFDFQTFKALSGSSLRVMPVVLGLRRAASVLDEARGSWTVYVDLSAPDQKQQRVLELSFALSEDNVDEQIQRFQKIVRTLKVTEKSRPRPSPAPATGTGAVVGEGQPCGGTAGILCPSGFYCQVTDASISSGVCRRL